MLRLQLRLAEANFQKAHQNTLLHATQAQSLNVKLTKALIALHVAQQQQITTMGEPEQYQTTALINTLSHELANEERCFAVCNTALQTAKVTLDQAKALLAIPQALRNPLNDDNQTPSSLANGAPCDAGVSPLLPTPASHILSAAQTLWGPKTINPKQTILLQAVLTSLPASSSP